MNEQSNPNIKLIKHTDINRIFIQTGYEVVQLQQV